MASVLFVVRMANSAEHFSHFEKVLKLQRVPVQIAARSFGLEALQRLNIAAAKAETLEAVLALCRGVTHVIADVGYRLNCKVFDALRSRYPGIKRYIYYDNPNTYVAGGYSVKLGKIAHLADGVLFANAGLVQKDIYISLEPPIHLEASNRIPLGFYDEELCREIFHARRLVKSSVRSKLFDLLKIKDFNQKILIFFGNRNYPGIDSSLKNFLFFLDEVSARRNLAKYIILIQQHPTAAVKCGESEILEKWQGRQKNPPVLVRFSPLSKKEALTVADVALFNQTSLTMTFALADIPAVQVGPSATRDFLVEAKVIPTLTSVDQWQSLIVQNLNDWHRFEVNRALALLRLLPIEANPWERLLGMPQKRQLI